MTPAQVELVQQSFAEVAPIADPAAAMFYNGCSRSRPRSGRCSAATWRSSAAS